VILTNKLSIAFKLTTTLRAGLFPTKTPMKLGNTALLSCPKEAVKTSTGKSIIVLIEIN
jgi:hypothetical protein